MTEAYARHLKALHARFQASDEVIRRAARAVSTRPLVAKTRIVHGEANEVYVLAYEGGLEVILHLARHANFTFGVKGAHRRHGRQVHRTRPPCAEHGSCHVEMG